MRIIIFVLGLIVSTTAATDATLPGQTQRLLVDGEPWLLGVPAGMQLELLTDRLDANAAEPQPRGGRHSRRRPNANCSTERDDPTPTTRG